MEALAGAPLPIVPSNAERAGARLEANAAAGAAGGANEELRRAALEFEAVFLGEMLAPMFENLDTDGLGGGGAGERMFRPMLVEEYAKAIAQAGGIGLADSVMAEMLRLQGAQVNTVQETRDGVDR